MANTEGLIPFKPGQCGNPKGRPKGTENSRTRLLRILKLRTDVVNPVTGKPEKFTILEQLDIAQIIKARKGNTLAYRELLDRFEGRSAQSIELKNDESGQTFRLTLNLKQP